MTQEDKKLLLKDLSARLPYGVKIMFSHNGFRWDWEQTLDDIQKCDDGEYAVNGWGIHGIKPYLRPLSSMTEDEFVYFMGLRGRMLQSYEIQSMMKEALNMPQFIKIGTTLGSYSNKTDWLNRNHFDYRGLIPKGLAIEVTENNNPYKE